MINVFLVCFQNTEIILCNYLQLVFSFASLSRGALTASLGDHDPAVRSIRDCSVSTCCEVDFSAG